MSNIVDFRKKDSESDVTYTLDDYDKIIAVGHTEWPFRIQRSGSNIAIVDLETETPFGEINADVFNEIAFAWLLADGSDLIDTSEEV